MSDRLRKSILIIVVGSALVLVASTLALPPDPLSQQLSAVIIAAIVIGTYTFYYRD